MRKILSEEQRQELEHHLKKILYHVPFRNSIVQEIILMISHWYAVQNTFSDAIEQEKEPYEQMHFHGPEITKEEKKRMGGNMLKVFRIMKDGKWRTIDEIRHLGVSSPPQSVAIYLRAFREPRYGSHEVPKRKLRINARIFEYRLIVNGDPSQFEAFVERETKSI